MTKAEWRAACKRTLVRIGMIEAENERSSKEAKSGKAGN
jgi:hypothetical protein